MGVTDHGSLTGLSDDDHPPYPDRGATETVSGSWTFDRGASAPFTVISGSAVVTDLDADKLDGVNITGIERSLYIYRCLEGGVTIDPDTGDMTLRVENDRNNSIVQVATQFLIGYGTYEYDVQINIHDGNTTMFFGFIEWAPSCADTNSIIFKAVGSNYSFVTTKDRASTTTANISGIDLTTKGAVKLVWASGSAVLSVDSIEMVTHSTNVPSENGCLFAEVYRATGTSTNLWMTVGNMFGQTDRVGFI